MTENKKYCCSNILQTETVILGTFDLVLNLILLGTISFSAYFYYFENENLKNTVKENPEHYRNMEKFLSLEDETQSSIMATLLFMLAIKVPLYCILVLGALQKKSILLKIWFVTGILLYLYSIIVTFVTLHYIKEKLINGVFGAFYLLFQLYLLWIVKLFTKELTLISAASESQLELDRNASSEIDDEKSLHSNSETQN